jgi:hypothetical protein
MSRPGFLAGGAALIVGLGLAVVADAQPAFTRLADDSVTTVAGIKTACTGVGLAMREEPRWKAFSVRVEVSTASRDYLGEERLSVAGADGKALLAVSCDSPWVLLGLAPGEYKVTAWSGNLGPKTMTIHAPAQGQGRFVVAFP